MVAISLDKGIITSYNSRVYSSMECKERLDRIRKLKKEFLQNRIKDEEILCCPYLDRKVATSWIRSRNMGVNPYAQVIGQHLSCRELEIILEKNSLLIEIAKPLFVNFKNLATSSGYGIYLFDKKGTFLLHEGEMLKLPLEKDPFTGMVWNEESVGTNAHSLCALYKHPVQLVGPEHYCVSLENLIVSAAPIFDESGGVIACLVLGQQMIDAPWDEGFQSFCLQTLGLITALAAAVEAQLKLKKSYNNMKVVNDNLVTANKTLEATFSLIDEGIITIDQTGRITCANREGTRILNLSQDEIGKRNLTEFLDAQSCFMNLIKSCENIEVEEKIYNGNEEQTYIINTRPVIDNRTKQLKVAVLRFSCTKKINALVTSRSGATANFTFADIIGDSEAINEAKEKAKRFSGSQESILLIGESGTGKEIFAQAIHNHYCPDGPFVAVNCAALPRELVESELFGYEGGSFTGADRHGRPGKIELAEGGTLFLDEIGDMPIELQAVLLRVLEDKKVMRIGGRRYKRVDFRVIAATNKNLHKLVREKIFREDLYYRLSVLSITIPPLRERGRDAEILAQYFIERYCKKVGRKVPQVSPAVLKIINEYDWPGNVRQLENAVIYAINTTRSEVIEPRDLPGEIYEACLYNSDSLIKNRKRNENLDTFLSLNELEKNAIIKALTKTGGNVPQAADLLGISRSTIYRKLKEYNIKSHEFLS